MLDQDMPV